MAYAKWIAVLSIVALCISCLFPLVIIESKDIVVTGFASKGTSFGKPGLIYIIVSVILLGLILAGRIWSLRAAFFFSVLNIAWALRNYIFLSACMSGICPVKKPAIYLCLLFSLLTTILIAASPAPQRKEG